jgi:hypothetical protein
MIQNMISVQLHVPRCLHFPANGDYSAARVLLRFVSALDGDYGGYAGSGTFYHFDAAVVRCDHVLHGRFESCGWLVFLTMAHTLSDR